MEKDEKIINQDLLNKELSKENFVESYKELSKYIYETPVCKLNDSNYNSNSNSNSKEFQNVYMKLENLQPICSYKIRSALNVCLNIKKNKDVYDFIKKNGIVTASAGNFSQGMAYSMNLLEFDCDLILAVPFTIPDIKLKKSRSYFSRVRVIKIKDKSKWYDIIKHQRFSYDKLGDVELDEGYNINLNPMYICPTSHDLEILGTGTIPMEIYSNDLFKDIDCFIVPWGGG